MTQQYWSVKILVSIFVLALAGVETAQAEVSAATLKAISMPDEIETPIG